MVRGRISPKTKRRFRDAMQDVVKGLSRRVKVNKQPVKLECPNCYFDKLTGRSTGKCKWTVEEAEANQTEWELTNPGITRYKYFTVGRCPICRGAGLLEIKRKAWVKCLVIWNPENRYNNEVTYTAAGSEGATLVQLKTDPKHYNLFKDSESMTIDGISCKLSKPPVLRGLGNETVLVISAFTTEKLTIDSNEIIKAY